MSPAPRRRGSHTQSVAPWPPSWTVAHSFWLKHSTHSPLHQPSEPHQLVLVLCNEEYPRGRAPTLQAPYCFLVKQQGKLTPPFP